MSIECSNTTPLSSQNTVTTAGVGPIDFSALLVRDPIDQLDRETIVSITNSLNSILESVDLSDTPTLKARFDQFPLTVTEIADYILTNNIDTVDILNSIAVYDAQSLSNTVLTNTVSDLDFFYEENLGKTISEGLCGKFGNSLMELLAAFTMIDSAITKLNGLKLGDLDPKKLAISKLQMLTLEEIKDKLIETITDVVDRITKKIDDAIKKAIEDITTTIGNAGDKILTQLTKMKDEIQDFFSEENMKRIKDDLTAFISEMIGNFERPTLANVQLIMYQLCNLTETITAILFAPADEIAEVAKVVAQEKKVLDTVDKVEQQKAEKAGATRVEKEVAQEIKEDVTSTINDFASDNNPNRYVVRVPDETKARSGFFKNEVRYRQPGELGYVDPSTGDLAIPTNVDYVTSPYITADETRSINAMSSEGIGPGPLVTFSTKVVDGKQWQGVANPVLAKLLRISHITGNKYTLRQGQVQTVGRGQANQAGKIRKQGSDGYHHKYSGFAVQLDITEENRDETIIAASRAGFTGIGVTKNYLLLHVGNREGFVATNNDPRFASIHQIAEAADIIQYEAMMNTHRKDGYRKRMEPAEEFRFFDKSTFKAEEEADGTFSFTDNNSILGVSTQEEEPFSLLRPTD